jgi:hypothetical protein
MGATVNQTTTTKIITVATVATLATLAAAEMVATNGGYTEGIGRAANEWQIG